MTDPKPEGPTANSDDGGLSQFRSLAAGAYARFLDALEAQQPHHPGMTSFEATRHAEEAQATIPWKWGATGELSEAINLANAWGGRVHEWGAWNRALEPYADLHDRVTLVSHFVEPIATYCLLQPSSLGDRVRLTAESLMHQANQRLGPTTPDKLAQDEPKPKINRFLSRSERLAQLKRLGKAWVSFPALRGALAQLNSPDYEKATGNFRDLFAHSLPPRFDIGEVTRARRSVGPRADMVKQNDGTYLLVEYPTKLSVQYAFCVMPPLDLVKVREANLAEYRRALVVMKRLEDLVAELSARMASAPSWAPP